MEIVVYHNIGLPKIAFFARSNLDFAGVYSFFKRFYLVEWDVDSLNLYSVP
jgi:hypothetical protein